MENSDCKSLSLRRKSNCLTQDVCFREKSRWCRNGPRGMKEIWPGKDSLLNPGHQQFPGWIIPIRQSRQGHVAFVIL